MRQFRKSQLAGGVLLAGIIAAALAVGMAPAGQSASAQNAQSTQRIIHTQDLWLFDAIRLTDASGNLNDLTGAVLTEADSHPGKTVQLPAGMTFTEALSLPGHAVAGDGIPMSNVSFNVGTFSYPNADGSTGRVLAVLASADVNQAPVTISASTHIQVDFSNIPGVRAGSTGDVELAFVQLLPPNDPSAEAGLSNLDIFVQRFTQSNYQYMAMPDQNGQLQPVFLIPAQVVRPGAIAYAQDDGGGGSWDVGAKNTNIMTGIVAGCIGGALVGGPIGCAAGGVVGGIVSVINNNDRPAKFPGVEDANKFKKYCPVTNSAAVAWLQATDPCPPVIIPPPVVPPRVVPPKPSC